MVTQLGISDEDFEKALKRHEDAFQKELEEISSDEKELKKMILKMKKAMIEQMRQNNSTYAHASDAVCSVTALTRRLDSFERRINETHEKLDNCIYIFSESTKLLKKMEEEKKQSFFSKLGKFFKCQKK